MLESGNAAVFTAGVRGDVPVQACEALVTVRFWGLPDSWGQSHFTCCTLTGQFQFLFNFFNAIFKMSHMGAPPCMLALRCSENGLIKFKVMPTFPQSILADSPGLCLFPQIQTIDTHKQQ